MEKKKPFVITPEMMAKAKTYMPLQVKQTLSQDIAKMVVVAVDYNDQDITPELMAVPPMMIERQDLKAVCLQRVFLSFYFDIDFTNQGDDTESFDYYGSSHYFNQLIRYKNNSSYKETAYNIEADFKEFKKFVETEVYNCKMVQSDSLVRLLKGISLFATPENVQKMQDALNSTIEQLGNGEKK
nr:MAG TPA: hypothetical protein [Caudoviricetes sp.]